MTPFAGDVGVEENVFPPAGELGPLIDGKPLTEGVVGADPGIVGSDSINEAPNDDDGLKGFSPENPVICGFTDVAEDNCIEGEVEVFVAPVG